jgi:hypothetical protein
VDSPASATPVLTSLGTFRAPTTGGWDMFTFVPLKTPDGQVARVHLQGQQTLRYTVEANGGDINYLMLCPTRLLGIHRDAGNVVLQWTSGILQSAPSLNGPWSNVTGATSPYTTPTSGMRLFRLVEP